MPTLPKEEGLVMVPACFPDGKTGYMALNDKEEYTFVSTLVLSKGAAVEYTYDVFCSISESSRTPVHIYKYRHKSARAFWDSLFPTDDVTYDAPTNRDSIIAVPYDWAQHVLTLALLSGITTYNLAKGTGK